MRRLEQFFNLIIRLRDWVLRRGPRHIPRRLKASDLAAVMQEAAFLRQLHGVEVRELAEGEEAGMPRPAGEEPPPKPAD